MEPQIREQSQQGDLLNENEVLQYLYRKMPFLLDFWELKLWQLRCSEAWYPTSLDPMVLDLTAVS